MTDDVDFFEEQDNSVGSERFKAEVTNLARRHRIIQGEIDELQNQVKELATEQRVIATQKLPDLLRQAGVKEITTLEGLKVSTKFVVGSIPAESKELAYTWLDEHGHSDIIKRNLMVQFAKGKTEEAEKAVEQLKALGLEPTLKMDIHPQTFTAFAREQITNGKMLPLDQWGCFYGDTAVIK